MADERVPMTRTGYDRLQEELKHLKYVDRHDIIAAIEPNPQSPIPIEK